MDEIEEGGRDLTWLPQNMPSTVRFILTTRPVDILNTLKDLPHMESLELTNLESEEIQQIINSYNEKNKLGLSNEDSLILEKRAAGNPLYLKVALDEITTSGIAVGQLELSVENLFEQILKRLEEKFGKPVLEGYLGLIAAGRMGVAESELQELMVHSKFFTPQKAFGKKTKKIRGPVKFFQKAKKFKGNFGL